MKTSKNTIKVKLKEKIIVEAVRERRDEEYGKNKRRKPSKWILYKDLE
jgi:hypothetical protein